MKFIGVDLHKKTISLCVMVVVEGRRKVTARRRFSCRDTAGIRAFFERQTPFRVVVEATATYEWVEGNETRAYWPVAGWAGF